MELNVAIIDFFQQIFFFSLLISSLIDKTDEHLDFLKFLSSLFLSQRKNWIRFYSKHLQNYKKIIKKVVLS